MTAAAPSPGDPSGYPHVWALAEPVGGWMTRDQGRALYEAASTVRAGDVILEIGSHKGRSTIVLAAAARAAGARVVAVDPFVDGRLFGGSATRELFEANLAAAGLRDVVELMSQPSTALRPTWTTPLAMLYIDGKHDYWTVRDDLRWTEHLPPGGRVLIHDSFSSVGVTLGLVLHALPSRRLRYRHRTGSLAEFDVVVPTRADRLRLLAQLPWFLRNLVIKIVLRVLRIVGYHGTPDPY